MTMSMIVPAIITAFSTLASVKKAYTTILKSENLELTKEQIAEYGAAQAKIAKTIATIKETIAENGLIGTIKLATVALWNEIKALVAKAAAWAMANPELAAAVAISTAFIGVSIAVASALNADAKAAENAANVLAETKQNLEDTKNIHGAVLCEHIRSIDYESRNVKFVEKLSDNDLISIIALFNACIEE